MTHVYLTVHWDSQVVLATPGSAELLLPAMCVVWFWFKWCSLCWNSMLCYWSQVTHRQAWTPLQRDTCTLPGPLSLLGEQSGTVTHGQGWERGRHGPCSHMCSHHWSPAGAQSMCNYAQSSDLPLEVTLEKDGEGNGTPLQYSCLENPMDGGAWWAAVHGVARVGHNWAISLSLFTFMHWRRKWQPTPVFLPGESQGQEAWWAAVYGVAQSRTRLKRHSSSSSRERSQFCAKNKCYQGMDQGP